MLEKIVRAVSGAARKARTTLVNIPDLFHTTTSGYVTLASCVILPGRIHRDVDGTYEYPDLNVTTTRHYTNRRFDKMCDSAYKKGYSFLSPRQFFDLKHLLESGRDVYDGTGRKISSLRVREMLADMFEAREPLRGEWLDARFEIINGVLYMASGHRRILEGCIEPMDLEPVGECLMDECDINFSSINRQGLPTKKGRDALYWPPKVNNESGTIFLVNGRRAFLAFSYVTENFNPNVGVRLVSRRI